MGKYILSDEAESDIDEIFDYGQYRFGHDQAIFYLVEMKTLIESLADNPQIGKERSEIKKGLFSFPYISHTIFYRPMDDYIRIIRILHGSRDFIRFLKK